MASVSKITLVGSLGRDPETRYTPNGRMNVRFSMAVSRRRNDANGKVQETVNWFAVTGWGRLAETLDRLTQQGALVKGKQVFVSGSFEAREYKDQQGQMKTALEVNADEILLLGSREGGGEQRPAQGVAGPADDYGDAPF